MHIMIDMYCICLDTLECIGWQSVNNSYRDTGYASYVYVGAVDLSDFSSYGKDG